MNDRKSEPKNKYQQYLDDTDDGRQSTHYEDCWRVHVRCAIAEAAAAHEKIAKVRAETIEECAKVCDKRAAMKAYDLSDDALIRYEQDKATANKLAFYIRALQEKAK